MVNTLGCSRDDPGSKLGGGVKKELSISLLLFSPSYGTLTHSHLEFL